LPFITISLPGRRRKKLKTITLGLLMLAALNGVAEPRDTESKNEAGLLLGSRVAADPGSTPNLSISGSLALQATYARWISQSKRAGLAFEIPFISLPSQDVRSAAPTAPRNYASLFITPGIRIRIAPQSVLSPWASVGGGYARFAESSTLVTGAPNPFATGSNKGALQFGGGVDWRSPVKLLVPVSFRGEVRDFFTGQPRLNVISSGGGQHNVLVSGGIVLHF
jgi:hypothetical protein